MERVNIPDGFFLKEAKQEYYNYKERLGLEVLQNSYDAGAKNIWFNFYDDSFEVIDDGHGMPKSRMQETLLSFGGSYKENDSCSGRFGKAKFLILFVHKSYIIHSLDTYVEGKVLNYEFIDGHGYINGTRIKVEFRPEYGYNKESCISLLKNSLSKCNLNCKVFINGEEFTDWLDLPVTRKMDWATLHVGKENKYENYLSVRHRGLWMFKQYVGDLGREVVIETTGSSLDLFTQNRDSFTGEYRDLFSSLIAEINIDKRSCLKKNIVKRIYVRGKNGLIRSSRLIKRLAAQINNGVDSIQAPINASPELIEAFLTQMNVQGANREKSAQDVKIIENYNFLNDFVYDLTNAEFENLPSEFEAKSMLRRYKFLATLYKNCILEICDANNLSMEFILGFCFDKDKEASVLKKDGIVFFINPLNKKYYVEDIKERFWNIFSAAIHECCHLVADYVDCIDTQDERNELDVNNCGVHAYHDEGYAGGLTHLTAKTLGRMRGWREIYNKTKTELE